MSLQLYAGPYDFDAKGFYFKTLEEFEEKKSKLKNAFGQPVEEFEIQFIDGNDFEHGQKLLDCLDLETFFEISDCWKKDDIFKLEAFIEFEGSSNLKNDLDEIKDQLDDLIFYKDSSENSIYYEIFENYYPELSKYLNDAHALNFFDEKEFLNQNMSGTFQNFGGYYIYLENCN